MTGMRQGEILALNWFSIDFTNKIIHIKQAWKNRKKRAA
jgi:integrase